MKKKRKKLKKRKKMVMYYKIMENCQGLVKKMECKVYYYKIKNKKKIYEQFAEEKENGKEWRVRLKKKIIIATNVFGIRIDVARIRVIVHTNKLRKILEYMQESSRTKWDKKNNEAIMIKSKIKGKERIKKKDKKKQTKKK